MNQTQTPSGYTVRYMVLAVLVSPLALWAAPPMSSWSDAVPDADTDNSVEGGCPHESRDGLTMYMASRRDADSDDLDIWVAHRSSKNAPFGPAEKLPYPVNTDADDFCPTPIGGNYLFFVSSREHEDACGGGDIYLTQLNPAKGYSDPVNLGCAEDGEGPNTAGGEFSPSLVGAEGGGLVLYYSTTGYGDMDIYRSRMTAHGEFDVGEPVTELNTEFDDRMPNVSRNGKEIVFSSNRTEWGDGEAPQGAQDVYYASRRSATEPWSEPVNLGPGINTGSSETRSSFSWDGLRLHFGRSGEIYVSERVRGGKKKGQ